MDNAQLALLLAPIVALDLGFRIWCLWRLWTAEPESLRLLPRPAWMAVVALVNFGWVAWLLAGRKQA